jgi:hypothetical protein
MLHFLKKYFLPNAPLNLMQFYQHAGLNKARWVAIAVNKKSIADSFLTKELDFQTDSDAYSLKMAETKKGILHQLWKNQESICRVTIEVNSPKILEFNKLSDKLIEEEILYFQKILNASLDTKTFSALEVSQEDKALEWMRVSFTILEKAIIESLTNPEFLFQALLFFGQNQKTGNHEIRVVAFNLDIKFELQKNNLLRVQIYNDKDAEFGTTKKAVLEGDFNFRKREMLDELTRMLSVLAPGIKW